MRLIRTLEHSFLREIFCFFHPYFKRYDVTVISLPEHSTSFPTGNAKIFRNFILAVFIFNLEEEKARTYRPVEHRCGISGIADLGPALKQKITRLQRKKHQS